MALATVTHVQVLLMPLRFACAARPKSISPLPLLSVGSLGGFAFLASRESRASLQLRLGAVGG